MNKRWFGLIIALFLMGRFAGAAFGLEPFKIDQYVIDRAGILTESQRDQLSNALYQYAQKTENQILVVIVPSLEEEELTDFTERLFELNKPGVKGRDNGAILLIANRERKIRLEVGYGLEEAVPDGRAGLIIREEIAPRFQNGDFYGGITAGVIAVIKAITPDYTFEGSPTARARGEKGNSFPAAFIAAMIIAFLSIISSRRGGYQTYGRRYYRGYSRPTYWGGRGGFGSGRSSGGGFRGGGGSFGGGGASGGW
ncbi:MAG: TPM domain-containing protein [Firmicutes bacterium]|nr:TPM domain-containing protein [Bacillota bacterium]